MGLEFILWLLVPLTAVAVVGHLIWIGVRGLVRGLASLFGPQHERPVSVELCPRCSELVVQWQGRRHCVLCTWSSDGRTGTRQPGVDRVLAQLALRVKRYQEAGLITHSQRDRLIEVIEGTSPPPAAAAAPASAPSQRPAFATPPLKREKPATAAVPEHEIEFLAPPAAAQPAHTPEPVTAHDVVESVAARARDFEKAREQRADGPAPARSVANEAAIERPAPAPKPPAQPLTKLLSAFLEEKNIRWGEVVGGLLIVGCSLALVISFWASIAERPWLKFGLFNGVTAALFAVGFHAERRWRLPTTARGLLVIATLLTPLNMLAVASLNRAAVAESPGTWIGEAVAIGLFAALCHGAGRYLIGRAPWTMVVGVVVPSAAMFLIRRLAGADSGTGTLLALGALPLVAQMAAVGGLLGKIRRVPEVDEPVALDLLRGLGLTSFATVLAMGLLVARSGPTEAVLHRLSPLLPLAGAPALATGLWLWRRTTAKTLAGYRTAGTSIAAAGLLVSLAAIALPWPDPIGILLSAGLNAAILVAIAIGFEIPAAHALAGMCLALVYLLGWLLLSGRIGWSAATSAQTGAALLSQFSGLILLPLVLLWLAVTAVAQRRGRPLDAQAYALVAGLVATISLGLVAWHGLGRAGDPSGATWVFAAYALVALGSAAWFGRWPLFAATTGLPELRVLTWLGSGLIFAALVQGLVFGARDGWGLPVPWLDVLLAHATLCLVAALLLARLFKARSATAIAARDILSQTVVPTAVVASASLLWLVPTAPLGSLAGHTLWLALVWLVLAWRQNSPPLFAAFQAALSGAVVCVVGAWLRSQSWFQGELSWFDPWSLQAVGIALSVLGLAWIALRLGVQRGLVLNDPDGSGAARLGRLLNPGWPAFDRVVQGVLLAALVFLAVYAVVPGAAQELTPRSLAAQLTDSSVSSGARVEPPAVLFEIPGVAHSHALGVGSWLLLGLILTMLLASQWQVVRRLDLVGALAVGAMGAPLLAGNWESQVAAASALRWASAGYLLGASALVWNRDRLGRFARRLGWPLMEERSAGLDELATVVVLILGMVPPLAMACYTGIAALEARPPDSGVTTLWFWVGMLFVVLSSVGIGLRWFGDAQASDARPAAGVRSCMRPASLLSLLLGSFPLVAVTGFAVSSALAGNPVVGPEPGSLFGRAGNAGSYVPPVLLLAVTLLGYAIRERSSGFAFAAALVLNVTATMGYLMAGVAGRLSFDAELWVRLAQLNAAVAAAYAIAWLSVLAGWSRRAGRSGLLAVPSVLRTLIALGIVLNLLMLGAGTVALWFEPAPVAAVLAMARLLGWIAFGLTVAAVVFQARLTGGPVVPGWLGMGLVSGAAMLALGVSGSDTGNWLAYHEMLANQVVAGLLLLLVSWNRAGLDPAALPWPVRRSAAGWSTLALGIVVLYAVGAYVSSTPQYPWWTLGGLAAAVLLSVGLAGWTFWPGYLVVAAVLVNLTMTLGWYASPWWTSSWRFGSPTVDLLNVNVLGLVLPVPLWLWLGRRISRTALPESLSLQERSAALVPVTLQRTVSWLALAGLGLGVVIALLVEVRSGNSPYPLLGWLAVTATAGAFAVGLWDQGSRGGALSGLYLLGLCAAGWALVPLRLSGGMLLWLGTVVLAAYAVLTSYLWSRRASFRGLAERWGIAVQPEVDAEASPSLLIAANLVVAAVVAVLSFGSILTDPDVIRRSSAADAVLASVLAIGLLAWGRRRSLLQGVALSVGVLGAIAWGWAWIEPHSAAVGLDRLVVVFAALVGSTVLYGLGLAKLFPRITEWTRAAQRVVPGLLVLSPLALIVVLGAELVAMSENRPAAMSGWAVLLVAATFLTAAVAALIAAVVPGRDPLGLTERGRTAYVYGAEVLLAVLFLHLRLTMPWLFGGFFTQFWPLILLGIAFLGVGLSELFRRQGRWVLAEPLERTGVLLPVLPLASGLWSAPQPGQDVVFFVLVGGLYTLLSVLRSSLVFASLAGLAFNGALWSLLSHAEGLGLLRHPQLWVIPPALCVLVGAYWNRDRLSEAQLAAIRYGTAILMYVSSLGDIVLTGVAQAPWLPGVLALLGIAGILAGIWLRVRGFLFLGMGAVCLAVFTIIWYAAVDLHQSWLWWACGIAAGILILILFGLFEKRRQEILQVVDRLKAWNT